MAAIDRLFRTYQVHATAAFLVEPGAGTQVLHREEYPFRFLPLPRPNLVTALFWTGRVLHGAGANRSDVTRYGLFVSFSVGWGRQEENHYLELPLEEALALPQEMRELIGYRMHTGLGFSEVYW